MKQPETIYPDISDILKAKAERRRDIARRSFGEKIAMMEALRARCAVQAVAGTETRGETCVCFGQRSLRLLSAADFVAIIRALTGRR